MDLERITLALRPRGDWEAIDLGLRLAQRNAGILYTAWFMSSAPLAILIGAGFIHFGNPLWAYFTFWLIKPLFDRVLLHLLGRLIFDERPDSHELRRIALRAPFQAAWIRAITWGRLDFSRSFKLPVWQLEGLRGAARRRRAGILGLGASGAAMMLSFGAFAAVALLYLAAFSLLLSFVVSQLIVFDFWSLSEYVIEIAETLDRAGPAILWASYVIYYLCEGFIAPFYVAGGFCLYLNRRTHLEAWDVELQFRRAIKRRGLSTLTVAAVVALATQLIALAPTARAQDEPVVQDPGVEVRREVRDAVAEILDDPAFGKTVKRTVWREKTRDDDNEAQRTRQVGEARKPSLLSRFFGSLAEVVLWSLVLAGTVVLVATRERWLPWLRGESSPPQGSPDAVGGLLLEGDDVPQDLTAQVQNLWLDGRRRQAASLLYRGTLTILNERHALKVHASDTEGDCARRVRAGTDMETSRFFSRVTRGWQRMAYAHESLSDHEMDSLCSEFRNTVEQGS